MSSMDWLERFPSSVFKQLSEKATAYLSYSLLSPVPRLVPDVCLETQKVLFTWMSETSKLEPAASSWDSSLHPMRTRSLLDSEGAQEGRGTRDHLHHQNCLTEPCLLVGC